MSRCLVCRSTYWAARHSPARFEADMHGFVHSLLSMGASPDGVSPGQITPLMIAAQLGNESIVRHLLDKGANVNRDGLDGTDVCGPQWPSSYHKVCCLPFQDPYSFRFFWASRQTPTSPRNSIQRHLRYQLAVDTLLLRLFLKENSLVQSMLAPQ